MMKKVLKGIGIAAAAVVAVVVIYIAYVMLTYYRLDDALPLEQAQPDASVSLPDAIDIAVSPELTVVTANLGFGAYGPDFDFFMDGGTGSVAESAETVTANINGSAEAIAKEDPNFILFQEVDIDGTRSHHVDEWALLRSDLAGYASAFAQNYDSPYLAWPPYAPHGANKAGMVTFSNYQIADSLRRSLPISEGMGKFLDLDRCYTLCRVHTVANGEAGPDLVLFNVHLSAYGADASIMEAQRAMLFEDMQRERYAGNYVVVGGDFNHDMLGLSNEVYGNQTATEASWAKPFDFESVPDGFVVVPKVQLESGVFDSAATCRDAGRPYDGTNDRWVMDGFIYSDNVEVVYCQTLDLDFAYSDHNPVVLTFRLS